MTSSEISDAIAGIAIVGMAGRFPGSRNIGEFWQNLRDGIESIVTVDPNLLREGDRVNARATIEDIDLFDASFFGFNEREASTMDPQHRIFLECAWSALEDAGYNCETYKDKIGVYGGVGWNGYLPFNIAPDRQFLESAVGYQTLMGNDKDFLTTRVSYHLNLKGPSIDVQTACSTSLVAVSMACQSLLSYQCDLALAGGITVDSSSQTSYLYQEGGILSPDGHCRAFDAQASGTVPGNGVGIVVLKRLEEAIADGDYIHAVIRGTAVNNDGANKVGYTAPSVDGQAEVIAEALALAGVEAETISYIEAHGTATPLGDPIEIAALTQVFRASTAKERFCAIGSVKTNIGHLDAAAGVAGLIKTVLALKHRLIPASLHFKEPNPQINLSHSPFYVCDHLQEWHSHGHPRRAGVSSFGIGGTNAHVILEEAPERKLISDSKPQLLLFSAKTSSALDTATHNLAAHLRSLRAVPLGQSHLELNLADIAYTLQIGRQSFAYRRMLVCQDREEAIAALEGQQWSDYQIEGEKNRPITFMFPGQGTQYVNMGKELYQTEPVFREQIDRCSELLKPLLGLDLREIIYPKQDGSAAVEKLKQTAISQPALFVIEYALAQLWISWGITPQAAIGHSIGEYVAACMAGVMSLEDALALVAARGRLMQQLPAGAMLSVALSATEVDSDVELSIAAINAPNSCVVSGTEAAIALYQQQLTDKGIGCRQLHTSHAFHSPMVDGILEAFRQEVRKVNLNPGIIPFISNVTGTWISNELATDPNYWVRHLRETVCFSAGIGELLSDPQRILLEVGPGNTLSTLANRHAPETAIASLRHPQQQHSDLACWWNALGKLWLRGVKIDWQAVYQNRQRYRVPLPTYPFERQRYWIEEKTGMRLEAQTTTSRGIKDWFYVPSWKLAPLSITSSKTTLSPYLVFVDECGLGEKLVSEIRLRGEEAIAIRVGAQFAKLSRNSYTINPLASDDYQNLINTLTAQRLQPQAIAHCWNVTNSEVSPLTPHHSLLFLAQALGRLTHNLQIAVISNNLQEVTGEEVLDCGKATLQGLVTVIPQEYPNIKCKSIDLTLPQPGSKREGQAIAKILSELAASDSFVAYRGKHRWVQDFVAKQLDEASSPHPRLRLGGVYLITGGLGGIGLVLARYLAEQVQAKLVLIGRSQFPDRAEWEKLPQDDKISQIQEIEALGSEVLVISADVSDLDRMQQAISQAERHFGQINGVIHAAGAPGGGVIQLKTAAMAEKVLNPKVKGTLVLKQVFEGVSLDFMVLCSSLTAIEGGFGQSDYASANAFLDAFARQESSLNDRFTVSIGWDTWQEVGMAANAGKSVRERFLAPGLLPQEGAAALSRILASGWNGVLVSKSEVGKSGAMLSLPTVPQPQVTPGRVLERSELEKAITAIWQELLGTERVSVRDNFFDLGGDSLLLVEVKSRLQVALNRQIATADLFEYSTIGALAAYLSKKQEGEGNFDAIAQRAKRQQEAELVTKR
jgi:acyl transferase domain-containing protein/acyl carrier protein